jgi:hypothetical protein
MLESRYKTELDKRLQRRFPGCVILKNDASYLQGVPDRLVLFEDKWAMLEGKRSHTAAYQPNQQYYVDMFDRMSFAAFIYPENEEEILDGLQHAFTRSRRSARVSQR